MIRALPDSHRTDTLVPYTLVFRSPDHPETRFRTCRFPFRRSGGDVGLHRSLSRFPFVPADPAQLAADCYEAFNIQVEGLVTRFRATAGKHFVIGGSGGLEDRKSTRLKSSH